MERILQVTYGMNRGGAETLIMNLFRNIDRNKVVFDFLENSESAGNNQYDDEIRALGGNIYKAPRYVSDPMKYYSFCKDFFEKHKEFHVVHGHFMKAAAPAYLLAAKKNGCYTIAHSHNTKDGTLLKDIALTVARYPVRYIADSFMGCSLSAGEYAFGKDIAHSARFHVLRNGINLHDLSYSLEKHEKDKKDLGFAGKFLIGNVGRLVAQKNHTFLLKVFSEVLKKRADAHLVIIGDGFLLPELKKEAILLGIDSHITFAGSVSDTSQYYSAMDLFLFPSLFEGLSLALLEAQAAGLPMVLSAAIPSDNIICKKNISICSLERSPEKWAATVFDLYDNFQRIDCTSTIRSEGYDILDVASFMQDYYLRAANKNLKY